MSYYRAPAGALRTRKLPEDRVLAVLRDVRELEVPAAAPPAEQFGPAARYAEQFDRGTHTSPGLRVVPGSAVLALAWLATDLALQALGNPVTTRTWQAMALALVILATGMVIGFALDHRLPAGFTRTGPTPHRGDPHHRPEPDGPGPRRPVTTAAVRLPGPWATTTRGGALGRARHRMGVDRDAHPEDGVGVAAFRLGKAHPTGHRAHAHLPCPSRGAKAETNKIKVLPYADRSAGRVQQGVAAEGQPRRPRGRRP